MVALRHKKKGLKVMEDTNIQEMTQEEKIRLDALVKKDLLILTEEEKQDLLYLVEKYLLSGEITPPTKYDMDVF